MLRINDQLLFVELKYFVWGKVIKLRERLRPGSSFIIFFILSVCQVFDWESFASLVRHHCLEPKNFDSDIEERILSSTSVYFSFVVDGEDDVNTPCWAQLDVLSAFNQAKGP